MFEVICILLAILLGITSEPLLQFIWHIIKSLFFHPRVERSEIMTGIKKSKVGAIGAIIVGVGCVVGIILCIIAIENRNKQEQENLINHINQSIERSNTELIETMNQNNKELIDRLDKILESLEANNGSINNTTTK